jgi:hypothetical protein
MKDSPNLAEYEPRRVIHARVRAWVEESGERVVEEAALTASAYRGITRMVGASDCPCMSCPDTVVHYCSETGTECRVFASYCEGGRYWKRAKGTV